MVDYFFSSSENILFFLIFNFFPFWVVIPGNINIKLNIVGEKIPYVFEIFISSLASLVKSTL